MRVILSFFCLISLIISATELDSLLKEAEENSPLVGVARARLERSLHEQAETLEFFDPDFFAGAGRNDKFLTVPLGSDFASLHTDAYDLEAGIELPVDPGFYLVAGGAHRILTDPGEFDRLYQTLYGLRVRIPLLNDRGFKKLDLNRSLKMAEYNITAAEYLQVTQKLRRDVEVAYFTAYELLCAWETARDAAKRFREHYEETAKLCEMNVAPEYQLFQSQMELQIGLDDEEKARLVYELSLVSLANAMGVSHPVTLQGDNNTLIELSTTATELPSVPNEEAFTSRGDWQLWKNNVRKVEVQQETARHDMTDKLDLQFGVSYCGEDTGSPWGMHEIITDRRCGTEVLLVWQRKIGYKGPRERLAQANATLQEINESLRNAENTILTEIQTAEKQHQAAAKRYQLICLGIDAARKNLDAEQERFRQGEGTSTNVTDAQKNFTAILQRQITAAADLLRAYAQYQYAIGYSIRP